MVIPSSASDWLSAANATKPPLRMNWMSSNSRNRAEIALEGLTSSLSDSRLEELLEGLEETRAMVFEKYYGSLKGEI